MDGKRFATPRGWEDLARFLEIYEKLGKTVDRDVIYQYIEHPGIAKDFANYLELYGKYKTDYQIERILQDGFLKARELFAAERPFRRARRWSFL